jgi:hypothetical protein
MMQPFPIEETRQALMNALPDPDQATAAPQQDAPFTYVPQSHALALDPENSIVEGIRGAGKSFWWAALVSEPHRRFVASAFPETKIGQNIRPLQGFGSSPSLLYPSKDTIASLVEKFEARHIWRAVIAVLIEVSVPYREKTAKWEEKVGWAKDHPEELDTLLFQRSAELGRQDQVLLILFDALDRLADNWAAIRPLARSLFQVALDFRGYRNIKLKIFVRPDMLEDREILAFPDSSKLLARKIDLVWRRADLYALVFQCLGNARTGGDAFRGHFTKQLALNWNYDAANTAWVLPRDLRADEDLQKKVFHGIAGPAMASGASGHKRGFPYTWLPNHLLDGKSQVSPRSFCAALRSASRQDALAGWGYPLDYKAIQVGVQEASRIRVNEITREDYPWIEMVMKPLRNKITVPCLESDIIALWNEEDIIVKLKTQIQGDVKLPPQHIDEGPKGVLNDLEALGVIQSLSGGRVQMPDVYRIAFSLGRRGGVRPLR